MRMNLCYLSRLAIVWLSLVVLLSLTVACAGAQQEPIVSNLEFAPQATAVASAIEAEASLEPDDYAGEPLRVDSILVSELAQAQGPRVIIYTGNISLVVKDTNEAVKAVTGLANEQGGYVSNANIYQYNEVPRGSITIRVPAESYEDTLAKLRALAVRVESESTNTQDVTEEFTDLEARKTNLEFTEAALQDLLEERQQVGETSDILEVYRELTNVRGQIEQIEGRMRYLANQSALSTITIELTPDVLYQPISVAGWQPQGVAKEALQALIVALQGLVNLLIWLIILVLPLLIIALLPVAILILIIRWWWQRRSAKQKTVVRAKKEANGSKE